MNCRELHSYIEEHSRENVLKHDSAEFAEHSAICGECSRWLSSQSRVWAGLVLLKQSAPAVSVTLDGVVLAAYRKRIAEREVLRSVGVSRKMLPTMGLGLAIAAVLLMFAVMFALRKPPVTANNKLQMQPRPRVTTPVVEAESPKPNRKSPVIVTKPHTSSRHAVTDQSVATTTSSSHHNSFPDGFRSLMFCDELICDGGMELVRVQFTPGIMGVNAASNSSGEVVSADVLLGADGFARGIRIER